MHTHMTENFKELRGHLVESKSLININTHPKER